MHGVELNWHLNRGASRDELEQASHQLGCSLSPSFIDFLQQSNGVDLAVDLIDRSVSQRNVAFLQILDLESLVIESLDNREFDNYASPALPPSKILYFAHVPSGTMFLMDPDRSSDLEGEYVVVPVDHDQAYYWRTEFLPVANSFGAWFDDVLSNLVAGKYFEEY